MQDYPGTHRQVTQRTPFAAHHTHPHQPGHGNHRPATRKGTAMTSTPPTSHKPARRRPKTALLATAAIALATVPAFAAVSALAPSAASAIPAPQKACGAP